MSPVQTMLLEIEGFRTYLLLNDKKASTVKRHIERLKKFSREAQSFDLESVQSYISSLKLLGRTNGYLNCVILTIRIYAAYINCQELIKFKLLKRKLKSNRTTLSTEEVEAFLSIPLQKGWHQGRYKMWNLFWTVCFSTGIRMGECANLTINDCDFGLGVLHLNGKTGKRDVPLPQGLMVPLKTYLEGSGQHLFPSGPRSKGKIINDTDWGSDFHKRIDILGIKRDNLVPYSSRHTFGTLLGAEDVNLYTIKELMGHSNILTTEQYMHASLKTLKKGQSKLPFLSKASSPLDKLDLIKEELGKYNIDRDPDFSQDFKEGLHTVFIEETQRLLVKKI